MSARPHHFQDRIGTRLEHVRLIALISLERLIQLPQ